MIRFGVTWLSGLLILAWMKKKKIICSNKHHTLCPNLRPKSSAKIDIASSFRSMLWTRIMSVVKFFYEPI